MFGLRVIGWPAGTEAHAITVARTLVISSVDIFRNFKLRSVMDFCVRFLGALFNDHAFDLRVQLSQ